MLYYFNMDSVSKLLFETETEKWKQNYMVSMNFEVKKASLETLILL